jgi:branched-subunit amino acid transport protein
MYPSLWQIVGVMLMGLCASFFYLYGEHERSAGWKWALISAGIWVVIAMLLGRGVLWQFLGQAGLFAVLTLLDVLRSHKARIIK